MAPRSSAAPPKLVHLHILYTVSPATQTLFVRSKTRVQVKQHSQLKGCDERWASCPVSEVVKAMLGKSPDLIPSSREDHSLHFNSPRDTFRESRYSSGQEIQPIEVQMGLVGWALDDTSEESKAMVMGVMRQDEVETEASDEEGDDAEEWLEIRLRLAKAKPVSHAQHLNVLSLLQRGETPPPPPPPPPPVASSPVTRSQSMNAHASSSFTPFAGPSLARSVKPSSAAPSSSRPKPVSSSSAPAPLDQPPPVKRPRGRPKGSTNSKKKASLSEPPAPPPAPVPAPPPPPPPQRSASSTSHSSAGPPPAIASSSIPSASAAQTPTNDASPPQDLLAALSQNFTSVTPEMLELIKLIGRDAHASADAETGDLVRSILNAAGAGGRNAPSPAPAVPTSLVTAKTEPVVASRSGGMGPPPTRASSTSDAEAKIRRVSAGKGKENEQASDVSMSAPTSSGSKKRKAKNEKVESCENCGATETSHWRKKTGSGMVCNACGIYWNRFKSKRPRELWDEPESAVIDIKDENRPSRSGRSSISMASSSTAVPGAFQNQILPALPPSPYNLRTSPARLDAARARAQAFLPMTSPLRSGKVSLLPLTSPVRAVKRNAAGQFESPRTALKKMLNGGSHITLSRLHKQLSDDGDSALTLTPGSDKKLRSSNLARGLPATGSSVGLGDEDMDLGGMGEQDDTWMHSDFSSFFSFNEDEQDEIMTNDDGTPQTNRTIDSSVMGSSPFRSSPFLAPFDFSTLPPSSPPTVSADLLSSPNTDLEFNSPLAPLGDDPSPAPEHLPTQSAHLDLESIKALFNSNSPASTSSATTIPTSAGFQLHDGTTVNVVEGNDADGADRPSSKSDQMEFLRLWDQCQGVLAKNAADGQTPGSEQGGGSGVTPPTWVTE